MGEDSLIPRCLGINPPRSSFANFSCQRIEPEHKLPGRNGVLIDFNSLGEASRLRQPDVFRSNYELLVPVELGVGVRFQ